MWEVKLVLKYIVHENRSVMIPATQKIKILQPECFAKFIHIPPAILSQETPSDLIEDVVPAGE